MKYNAHRCKIQLLICSNGLMRSEDSLGDAAGLKERKAQQDRIAHATPDGGRHIPVRGDGAHQHRVDRHTHDDEKRLESQRKQ